MALNAEIRRTKTSHRLQTVLDTYGITPSALAEAAGLHRSCVCRYISGVYTPSRKNAEKLASILHVDPAWLQGKEDPDRILRLANNFNMLDEAGKNRVLEYSETLLQDQCRIYEGKAAI